MTNFVCNTNPNFLQEESQKKTNGGNASNHVFDEKLYLDTRLKENEKSREMTIRILPISIDNPNPWVEVDIHSLKVDHKVSRSGFKTFTCLNMNSAEKVCPICAKGAELWYGGIDKIQKGDSTLGESMKKEAVKFFSKKAYIVRCIERGKEADGPKFWRFYGSTKNNGLKDKLLSLAQSVASETKKYKNIDNYNIFDLYNGRDINLVLTESHDNYGKKTTIVNVNVSSFESPLSVDVELANCWLNNPMTWKDVYVTKTADYLSVIADGKVPVRDASTGKYVAAVERNDEANQGSAQGMVQENRYAQQPQATTQPVQYAQQPYVQQQAIQQQGQYVQQQPVQYAQQPIAPMAGNPNNTGNGDLPY